jgi:hypothetical protein
MASISSPYAKPADWRRDTGRAGADDAVVPLVFSGVGLLTDVLALLMQGAAPLGPLRFALIAGAAPLAALVALRLTDRADAGGS